VTESETFTDVCPACGTEYGGIVKYCAQCGGSLHDLEPERSVQLAAGTIVGSYRLLDLLGEGGMGRVYLAEHIKLGRRVALKMLRPEFGGNPIAVARFFAEARAVNRISHDNIVEITDFLDQAGLYNSYIMELLRGEDLGLRLLRTDVLPIAVAVEIGAQIASALTAVHAVGIVHRDLKPDNIFLIDRGGTPNFVKLLDFGVAKLSGVGDRGLSLHTTALGQVVGTPEYMSPEQAGGEPVDHRADIYALGVILYETVTGRLPFQAKNFGELVLQHLTAPPPRPTSYSDLPHQIPPALDDLIVELLAKAPADRPQSMVEIEQRLQAIHDALDLPPVPRRISSSGALRLARMETGPVPRITPKPQVLTPNSVSPARAVRAGSAPNSVPPARAGAGAALRRAVKAKSAPRRTVERSAVPRLEWWLGAGIAMVLTAFLVVWSGRTSSAEASAEAPPRAAAPAVQVQLRFTSTPSGAAVRDPHSGMLLGTTPFLTRLPREHRTMTVEVSKHGYQPATQDIDLRSDGGLMVALVAAAPPPPPAP
jgi:eukaryotic-like serine/threonine-protein kinase